MKICIVYNLITCGLNMHLTLNILQYSTLYTLLENYLKFPGYNMKRRGKPDTTRTILRSMYNVFPATFHVISRKVDNLWDSVLCILFSSTVPKNMKKYESLHLCLSR